MASSALLTTAIPYLALPYLQSGSFMLQDNIFARLARLQPRVLWLSVIMLATLALLYGAITLPGFAEEETPSKFVSLRMPNISQLLYSTWNDAETVRLKPADATVHGYTPLMSGDFLGKGEAGETVTWKSPVAGLYHIGLVMHDSGGVEKLDVLVHRRRVGTITADSETLGQVMFVSPEPVRLRIGEPVHIVSREGSAAATFGNVCLLTKMPQVPRLVIENLTASHRHGRPGHAGRVSAAASGSTAKATGEAIMIAWTTNRPAEGAIRLGSETIQEDRGPVNNHFVMLPAERINESVQLQVVSSEPKSRRTATAELTVYADPLNQFRAEGGMLPTGVTEIELAVDEPTDKVRTAWPVSSGVPLPLGTLVDAQNCRLLNSAGEEVPAQFAPLAWHADGVHVKWLLVDFAADTTGNSDGGKPTRYTLQCGKRSELPVATTETAIDVRAFEQGFAPLAAIKQGNPRAKLSDVRRYGFEVTDGEGRVYSSANLPPEEVVVEDSGPIRTTVRVRGKMAAADGATYTRYLCRLHAYAGQSKLRVVFSLDNDVREPEMNVVGSLKLRLPVAASEVRYGADGEAHTLKPGERLLQDEDFRFLVEEQKAGKRADGWFMVPGELALHVRDFWQLYPKGFVVEDDSLVLELMPKLPVGQYAGVSDDDLTKLYYWCDKGRYKIRTGVRLTTEFTVDLAPGADAEGNYADAERLQNPLFATCSPEWYCQSGALGPIVPRRSGQFDIYEKNLDTAFAVFLQRQESAREYGLMNYGDWFGERKHNWGNIEYDTPWALAANFARTGNLAMLRRAIQAESHNADVDTKHYGPAVGEVWAHCTGHTGGYFPRSWKNMTLFNEGVSGTGHTWCQGHFVLYGLTGERRYLETGRKIADRLAVGTTDFRYYAERNVGWPMVGLMGAHRTTANPFHLNGAKLIADTAMWTQSPDTGGWGHWIDTNECRHGRRCWGCKTFMTGVLLHGLKLYDLGQPRDDIRRSIVRNCDFIWRTCYVPRDQGFIYSECLSRRDQGRTGTFSIVGDGLAYGCRLDPQHRHRESLRHAAMGYFYRGGVLGVKDFGKGTFGKKLTNDTCFMPLLLHDLAALQLTRFPVEKTTNKARLSGSSSEQAKVRPTK